MDEQLTKGERRELKKKKKLEQEKMYGNKSVFLIVEQIIKRAKKVK